MTSIVKSTQKILSIILSQDPIIVLAPEDLSYNGKAKCWLQLIELFKEKTKVVRELLS